MNGKTFSQKMKFFILFMVFMFLGIWSINIINASTVEAVNVVAAQTAENLKELTNTSTFSATSIVKGGSIKMTGSATGGTGSYQYAMVARHSTSTQWTVLRNYSTVSTHTWTPAKTGTYYVSIKVKDSNGTVVARTQTIKVAEKQLVNSSTFSAATITKGSSLKMTGSATGGTGSYQYAMVARHSTSTQWTVLRNYSTVSTHTWTPAKTGTYYVSIKVKDSSGTVVAKTQTIKVTEKQLVNSSTFSAATITKGSSLELTGSATGGTGSYQYAMVARHSTSTQWTVLRNYSTVSTYTWTPAKTGTYYVSIKVKDSNGTVVAKTQTITVNAQTSVNDKTEAYIDEVIRLVNVERQKNGLPALVKRDDVCKIAAIRAEEIVTSFSHTRPNGSSCFSLFEEYNISYRTVGENIAYGYSTPAAVMEGWMNSEGHKANILSENYDGIGVGCYEKNGVLYWTQFFIGSTNKVNGETHINTEMYADDVMDLINAEREKNGLSALTQRDDVCAVAEIRAEEISVSFSNTRPNGSSCFSLFEENNISYSALSARIAYGYSTPEAMAKAWLYPEGGQSQLLSADYDGMGVGCYEKNGVLYWSLFLIRS